MLMGAAAFSVGALSGSAQTVYSANVVGYVNTVVVGTDWPVPAAKVGKPHYTLIANPLDNGSGNTVSQLFPGSNVYGDSVYWYNPPHGPAVFPGANGFNQDVNSYGWTFNVPLPPGTGFFFYNGGPTFTNTFVGTVLQGNTTNAAYPSYTLLGSIWPASGYLVSNLNFTAKNGDAAFMYDQQLGFVETIDTYGWTPAPPFTVDPSPNSYGGPLITNGMAFFYLSGASTTNYWTQNFTVH
jgi:hypothetical protein